MNRHDIINALEAKGYQAKKHDVVKNSQTFKGIVLNTGSTVNPVFYTDFITESQDTPEDVAERILEMQEASISRPIDPEKLSDKSWIYDHLTIAVQRESDEELVKKLTDFAEIEQYLILVFGVSDASYSIKVTPALLANVGLAEDEAWLAAKHNLEQSIQIVNLQSMITDVFWQTFGPEGEDPLHIHVATTTYRTKGAAAILCRDKLYGFMDENNVEKLLILPSSIHEALIVPYYNFMDIDYFSQMVKEINESQVSLEEQLADRAYLYE